LLAAVIETELVLPFLPRIAGGLCHRSRALAFDDVPTVTYLPAQKLVEGDEPLASSYVLSITSPSNVPVGTTVSITPVVSILGCRSAERGASAGLCFAESSTLSFTGPGQVQTMTVSSAVPSGSRRGKLCLQDRDTGLATGPWMASRPST